MKVGDYVRIKNNAGQCYIGKIVSISDFREPDYEFCIDIQSIDYIFIPKNMIVKSSPNVIDLIEVGDYVNGSKVYHEARIDTDDYGNDFKEVGVESDIYLYHYVEEKDIKSIVTKEQFEGMEYKI